ncbi:transcriptional regulator GcvA [Tepidicaulis sp.]|uniref:transcriptional regulator GcvA n=1 Tax=Tepidicaulis sp. TaxID=1920809 RepID=UPI003B5D060B
MSRRLPPLSMLRSFEAAARHLSFSRAAEELSVTHSAISHQIRGLEEWLGCALFRRSGRAVHLTQAGERLLGPLTRAFDGMNDAVRAVTRMAEDRAVVVSVEPAFAARWLVLRLDRFYQRHPNLRLHLVPTPEMVDLTKGDVDVAIRYGRGTWPGLKSEKIMGAAAFPVLSPALIGEETPLQSPHDLSRFTLIHEDTTEDWAAWLKAAGAEDVDAARGPIFDDGHLALEAATMGQGVALADEALAAAALQDGRLVRPFDLMLETSSAYYVVTAPVSEARADVSAFCAWLLEEAHGGKAPVNWGPANKAPGKESAG